MSAKLHVIVLLKCTNAQTNEGPNLTANLTFDRILSTRLFGITSLCETRSSLLVMYAVFFSLVHDKFVATRA